MYNHGSAFASIACIRDAPGIITGVEVACVASFMLHWKERVGAVVNSDI